MVKLEQLLNYNGHDWGVLSAYLKQEIENHVNKLKNPEYTWDQTQLARGAILALQAILDTERYHRESVSN